MANQWMLNNMDSHDNLLIYIEKRKGKISLA